MSSVETGPTDDLFRGILFGPAWSNEVSQWDRRSGKRTGGLAAFNYARWLTRNDADAKDIVQAAAIRALLLRVASQRQPSSVAAHYRAQHLVHARPAACRASSTRRLHMIHVFVWPARADVRARDARTVRGFHEQHWTTGDLSVWAVSDVNEDDLRMFADLFVAGS